MSPTPIETDRLVLRGWEADDLDPLAALCADPEVMRHIGEGTTRDRASVAGWMERLADAWKLKGYGQFAVALRETGEFIGFAGFSDPDFMPELLPATEIGWRLARAHWDKGYGTEAAGAALAFARQSPDIDDVVSICQVGNDASIRIMEKIGLAFDRRAHDPSCGRDVLVYRLPA